jgi:hypothetical protein
VPSVVVGYQQLLAISELGMGNSAWVAVLPGLNAVAGTNLSGQLIAKAWDSLARVMIKPLTICCLKICCLKICCLKIYWLKICFASYER